MRLGGGKQVVVDAKVSLAAYLDAAESRDPDVIEARHAGARPPPARARRGLAAKEYWRAFEPTPEFVVLFVPGDAFLAPALERDPRLLDDAMARAGVHRDADDADRAAADRGLLLAAGGPHRATPGRSSSSAASSTVDSARWASTSDKLGRTLTRSVEDYNSMVGSLERSVLVQARRMADLQVTDADLTTPIPLTATTRPLGAPELLELPGAGRGRQQATPGPTCPMRRRLRFLHTGGG